MIKKRRKTRRTKTKIGDNAVTWATPLTEQGHERDKAEHWRIMYDLKNHECEKLKQQLAAGTPAKAQAVTISMNTDKLLNIAESLSLALERMTDRERD